MKLYGIANCNTVKKARDWLAQHDIAFEFHDFKKHGLDAATAQNWLKQSDWNKLVNRSGLTWRALPDERKLQVCDAASAAQLMLDKPSVIKRPLLEQDGMLLHTGFDAAAYEKIFNPGQNL
jgi:Spx/MgsR family transcriptional regulator